MTLNGTELGGFFSLPKIESGVDASNLVLVAGKPLKLPKDVPPPSITLSRGFDHDLTLSHWSEAAFRGDPEPPAKRGPHGADDYLGEPVAVWRLTRAWPSKYKVDTSSAPRTSRPSRSSAKNWSASADERPIAPASRGNRRRLSERAPETGLPLLRGDTPNTRPGTAGAAPTRRASTPGRRSRRSRRRRPRGQGAPPSRAHHSPTRSRTPRRREPGNAASRARRPHPHICVGAGDHRAIYPLARTTRSWNV